MMTINRPMTFPMIGSAATGENPARTGRKEQHVIEFFVPGVPVPKGSTRAFVVKGRAITTGSNAPEVRTWQGSIAQVAERAGVTPKGGPVELVCWFVFPRPKSHYRTGKHAGELRNDAPTLMDVRPDKDKLERAVLDALTGVAYRDDAQVALGSSGKRYTHVEEVSGVHIRVRLAVTRLPNTELEQPGDAARFVAGGGHMEGEG